jgi:hypothetical protein
MNPNYPRVAQRASHRCEYCHAPEGAFNFPFEVEHIAPTTSGGPTELDNLALACRSCNAFKSSRVTGVDPESQALVPLYHPRRDVWDDHFAVEPERLEMVGRTRTGRATVVVLQMNAAAQLMARRQWQRLDLFP